MANEHIPTYRKVTKYFVIQGSKEDILNDRYGPGAIKGVFNYQYDAHQWARQCELTKAFETDMVKVISFEVTVKTSLAEVY